MSTYALQPGAQLQQSTHNSPVLVALGSNQPAGGLSRDMIAQAAVQMLAKFGYRPVRCSRQFRTPAWPAGSGPDYVNAALMLRARGDPHALISVLHRVEAAFGRVRVRRFAPRPLDLDLIAWGDAVLPDAATQTAWRELPPERLEEAPGELILPHPRLEERAFVLVPLAEVAPDWRHPLTGRSVAEMLAALPPEAVRAIVPL